MNSSPKKFKAHLVYMYEKMAVTNHVELLYMYMNKILSRSMSELFNPCNPLVFVFLPSKPQFFSATLHI